MAERTDAEDEALLRPVTTLGEPSTCAGLRRSASADDSGRFNFPQLKPGTYSVKVEAEGLESQQDDAVSAGLGQKQTVDFIVSVAQAKESIEAIERSRDSQPRECEYLDDSQCTRAGRASRIR